MSRIPLVDLQAQYQSIKAEIDTAVLRVLESGQYILGPEVEALEREVAVYCGTRHAVGVASGTDALELSLRACGIGPGAEVITTAFSFFATAEAILLAGATPVFVDIEPATYNLDPAVLANKITPRTKAILPVHLYGHPCAMDRIMEFARAHGLRVIEDCAQAIGATFGGRCVGSFGEAGCLSFYPTKNLSGAGDGGMVVTNDAGVAEQVRLLRNHGSRERYHHVAVGCNSRLDELQAAILRVKLRHLDRWNQIRRAHAQRYASLFQQQKLSEVILPRELPSATHVYHLYTIRLPRRDEIQRALAQQGIATQVAYPKPLPAQSALRGVANDQSAPQATTVSREVLALPIYPELTNEMASAVVNQIASAFKN